MMLTTKSLTIPIIVSKFNELLQEYNNSYRFFHSRRGDLRAKKLAQLLAIIADYDAELMIEALQVLYKFYKREFPTDDDVDYIGDHLYEAFRKLLFPEMKTKTIVLYTTYTPNQYLTRQMRLLRPYSVRGTELPEINLKEIAQPIAKGSGFRNA